MTGTAANSNIPLLCSLTTSEQFVLTAARLWVTPYRDANAAGVEWQDGFVAAGLGEVACVSFEIMMCGVAAARRTGLDIRWPCCPRLGGDELCMLDCLSLLQNGRSADAVARLTAWLSPGAMRVVHSPAQRLTELFREAGLLLPARTGLSVMRHEAFENYRHLDRGALLVH